MTKICFTPLLTCPQGCQGCQIIQTTKLKSTLVSWSAKIQPKLKKLWKTVKIEQKLSKKPCFLKVFPISFNLGWILALQLTYKVFNLVFQIFWHPWGRFNSGKNYLAVNGTQSSTIPPQHRDWSEITFFWENPYPQVVSPCPGTKTHFFIFSWVSLYSNA